ncbi:MAG TPA: hypothetical protein ENG63_06985 [Candidatus Desulfofervidus auxilii]|uniref:Lipoprotein n=1 Tax=Desulfofervidus auxilii TaxID=1621989 RepID=A0A7C0U3M6_DESA2|nr:hypothetical protein [Candidatus Desulfofervidus auxilii]
MYKFKVFILGLILILACAHQTFVDRSYKILATSKVCYETIMESAADLYRQGKLNEEQKEKIIEVANHFYLSYLTAVNELETYVEAKENKDEVVECICKCLERLIDLKDVYKEYGLEVPEEVIRLIENLIEMARQINIIVHET